MVTPTFEPNWGDLEGLHGVILRLQLGGALTCGLLAPTFNLIFTTKTIALVVTRNIGFCWDPQISVGESNPPQADLYNALQCLERE